MTAEERVTQVPTTLLEAVDQGQDAGPLLGELLAAAIRQAEAEIKERCAKIADMQAEECRRYYPRDAEFVASTIAASIRALE